MKAPFPYFGGKSKVASLVWERFGNVPNYIEPFFGSGAVLLDRPFTPGIETVNDANCFVANLWRALSVAPDEVAQYADWPVNEADQHARHLWLVTNLEFQERMKTEPDYFDSKVAGYWVWGQCIWIGSGWCGTAGTGVHRKRPHLGNAGTGVHRQLPHLGNAGKALASLAPDSIDDFPIASDLISATREREFIASYLGQLAQRLRRVRVCCGDWSRICGPSPTFKHGMTGVFLDPPYADKADRTEELYGVDDLTVAHDVREWAIANGDNPLLRIALCGYEGEHQMPDSWKCIAWKARGGYGSQGYGRGRDNAGRERIWFSRHCLDPQASLFGNVTDKAAIA